MIALRFLLPFALLLVAFSSRPLSQVNEDSIEWRKPTISEITNLFYIATRKIPEKMILEAVVKEQSPPYDDQPEEYRFPAFSTDQVKEWFSGRSLYRKSTRHLKSVESLAKGYKEAVTKGQMPAGALAEYKAQVEELQRTWGTSELPCGYTKVTVMDSRFLRGTEHPDVKTFTVTYYNRNDADVDAYVDGGKTPSNPAHLWKAWRLHPDLTFPLAFSFAESDVQKAKTVLKNLANLNSYEAEFESFSDLNPSINKIKEALQGNGNYEMLAREEMLNGVPTTRIKLHRPPSEVATFMQTVTEIPDSIKYTAPLLSTIFGAGDYSYWLDKHDPPRLLRAEKTIEGKRKMVHVWHSFNQQGFPMYWRTEEPDPIVKEVILTNIYNFVSVDMNPDFRDEDAFGLSLWDGIK